MPTYTPIVPAVSHNFHGCRRLDLFQIPTSLGLGFLGSFQLALHRGKPSLGLFDLAFLVTDNFLGGRIRSLSAPFGVALLLVLRLAFTRMELNFALLAALEAINANAVGGIPITIIVFPFVVSLLVAHMALVLITAFFAHCFVTDLAHSMIFLSPMDCLLADVARLVVVTLPYVVRQHCE
jgi:hypothetical protein